MFRNLVSYLYPQKNAVTQTTPFEFTTEERRPTWDIPGDHYSPNELRKGLNTMCRIDGASTSSNIPTSIETDHVVSEVDSGIPYLTTEGRPLWEKSWQKTRHGFDVTVKTPNNTYVLDPYYGKILTLESGSYSARFIDCEEIDKLSIDTRKCEVSLRKVTNQLLKNETKEMKESLYKTFSFFMCQHPKENMPSSEAYRALGGVSRSL